LVAAPILSAFLSKAAAVVDRVFSSAARTALRAREEFFRADARSKREDVRSSWVAVADSRVLAVRVDGVEVVMEVGDVVVWSTEKSVWAVVVAKEVGGLGWRARIVDSEVIGSSFRRSRVGEATFGEERDVEEGVQLEPRRSSSASESDEREPSSCWLSS
jgi:hypothetical protein